ncbi:ArsR/SmtB family transcription factor [Chthonobacter rhizosphaerae]|uniref:ArsR/SmtB family transcription factor n=1 Tax=Chthonobacter rhizosphaerae TaxID=2735553 RepID=UPI0015EF0F5B|nr:metalloregulator ArsR/SmtB family transcription factor [Chthonobacter rhizosphaerae]
MQHDPNITKQTTGIGDIAKKASDTLRALSHEHRLMIIGLLARGEKSVGELERILELPQPAVSQQLARLRLDNLVTCRRDGRTIYYSVTPARIGDLFNELSVILLPGEAHEASEVTSFEQVQYRAAAR